MAGYLSIGARGAEAQALTRLPASLNAMRVTRRDFRALLAKGSLRVAPGTLGYTPQHPVAAG